jgi:hypothetical protein
MHFLPERIGINPVNSNFIVSLIYIKIFYKEYFMVDFCPKGFFGVAVIIVRQVVLSKYRASNHIQ